MDRAGNQLLAGAGFSIDQHRGVCWRHHLNFAQNTPEGLALTDDILEHGRRQNLVAKVQRFLVQFSVDSRAHPVRSTICEMVGYAIRYGPRTQGSKSI